MKNDPRRIELELPFFLSSSLPYSFPLSFSDKSLSFSLKAILTIRGCIKEKDRKGKQRKCINTMEIKVLCFLDYNLSELFFFFILVAPSPALLTVITK